MLQPQRQQWRLLGGSGQPMRIIAGLLRGAVHGPGGRVCVVLLLRGRGRSLLFGYRLLRWSDPVCEQPLPVVSLISAALRQQTWSCDFL